MKEKKSKLRQAVVIVSYVLVFALVAVIAFVLSSNFSGKVPFIAGKTMMWVKTSSMEPLIPERSYILVEKIDAADVQVGDVIVFESDDPTLGGAYNTHRVIEIRDNHRTFVTKGDNNLVQDKMPARATAVLGIYRGNLPIMSRFGRFMSTPIGITITFTLIFVIMPIVYVPDMKQMSRKRAEQLEKQKQERINALVQQELEKLRTQGAPAEPPAGPTPGKEEPIQ